MMVEGLIGLLIVILVVGVIAWLVVYLIDTLPIDPTFKQVARVIVLVVAVLIILLRALPLLGVALP